MAVELTPRYPADFHDAEEDYDVMSVVTSTAIVVFQGQENGTRKMTCSVGDNVTQRITVLSVTMICTIVGNLALILALTCGRACRIKRVNVFLVNLAIGDLAVAVFTNATEIVFLAFGDWTLGPAVCKIMVYVQIVTLASATFLLTAMSVDRYQVIVKPLQSLAQRPRIWLKVAIAWVMSFIFATPQLFIFLQVTEEQDGVRRRCCVSKGYTHEWQRKVYLTFMTSYILLVPTAIMIYCYAKIIHVIWIRARAGDNQQVPSLGKDDSPGSPRMSMRRGLVTASKRRVIIMTLTVVAGFLVCQTPYFIILLVRAYSDYKIKLSVMLSVFQDIVLMHSTLNPVLYGLFTLRSYHLKAILECFTCTSPPASRGERRVLLHGKCVGKAVKPPYLPPPTRQLSRERAESSTAKKNGIVKDGVACKTRNMCSENNSAHNSKPRKRDRGAKHDYKVSVPLLLIENKAAVEDPAQVKSIPEDCDQQSQKGKLVCDGSSSEKWGKDVRCVIHRGPYGIDRSSVSCSQWTPCHADSTECYSCV